MTERWSVEDYRAWFGVARRNKFNARRVVVDGITFDSRAEAARYGVLRLRERAGDIEALVVHPRYEFEIRGHRLGSYTADFRYIDRRTRRVVVEDVKSAPTRTRDYLLRLKLMRLCHGIEVQEVRA